MLFRSLVLCLVDDGAYDSNQWEQEDIRSDGMRRAGGGKGVCVSRGVGEQGCVDEQMDLWLTFVSRNPNVFNALRCALHKD